MQNNTDNVCQYIALSVNKSFWVIFLFVVCSQKTSDFVLLTPFLLSLAIGLCQCQPCSRLQLTREVTILYQLLPACKAAWTNRIIIFWSWKCGEVCPVGPSAPVLLHAHDLSPNWATPRFPACPQESLSLQSFCWCVTSGSLRECFIH